MNGIPFHLAFPILSLDETKHFYCEVLGCTMGRSAERWVDFDFFGHQLSAHLVEKMPNQPTNEVDGKQVPVQHFGAILSWDDWHALKDRLKAVKTAFVIEPYIRFVNEPGEQATMFLLDPSGNALEFKAFKSQASIFATK